MSFSSFAIFFINPCMFDFHLHGTGQSRLARPRIQRDLIPTHTHTPAHTRARTHTHNHALLNEHSMCWSLLLLVLCCCYHMPLAILTLIRLRFNWARKSTSGQSPNHPPCPGTCFFCCLPQCSGACLCKFLWPPFASFVLLLCSLCVCFGHVLALISQF